MSENKIVLVLETKAQNQGIIGAVNALKGLGAVADSVDATIKRFGASLVSAFSAGAIVAGFKSTVNAADDLSKAAQRAGVAVETFSALAYVGKLANVSAEELVAANKYLSAWLEKTGQSGRSLTEVLIEQSDVFAAMPDGVQKIRLAVEMFGKAGQQMIPLLNQGSAEVRKFMEEAKQFDAVVGPRFSANAQTFNDNLTRMHQVTLGFRNLVADGLLPALIEFQEKSIDIAKEWDIQKGAADSVLGYIRLFSTMLTTTFHGFDHATGAIRRFGIELMNGKSIMDAWESGTNAQKRFQTFVEIMDLIRGVERKPDPAPQKNQQQLHDQFEISQRIRDQKMQELNIDLERFRTRGLEITQRVQESQLLDGTLENAQLRVTLERRLVGTLADEAEAIKRVLNEQIKLVHSSQEARDRAKLSGALSADDDRKQEIKDRQELLRLNTELLRLKEATGDFTFGEKLRRNFDDLAESWRNLGANIANTLTDGVLRSIDAVANGLWAVIDGTRTWGEIFLQVGRSIISDLIRIALQETIVLAIKRSAATTWKAFTSAMRTADVVEHNAAEAAKAPALAANATLASISSWGIAVVIGLAAIAGILASMGAFEKGGVVQGGKQIIMVNESGQEAVLNARATAALGEDRIAAMNAGRFDGLDLESRVVSNLGMNQPMPARDTFMPVAAGTGDGKKQSLILFLVDKRDPEAFRNFVASEDGKVVIAEAVKDKRIEIGIPT